MRSIFNIISSFWRRHPGLLYGIAALIGSCSALTSLSLLFPLGFLTFFGISLFFSSVCRAQNALRLGLAISLGLATFMLTHEHYHIPNADQTDIEGTAYFKIFSISTSKNPFQKAWTYKGVLHSFIPDSSKNNSEIFSNTPINILIPQTSNIDLRPNASYHYRLHARLRNMGENRYSIIPLKDTEWTVTKKAWNLVEWRLAAKSNLAQHIQHNINDPHVSSFLTGIATGDFNDRMLSYELSRFGLQHLMAISGLHFAIIASILGFGFRLFFSTRISAVLLITALSSYFLFLGDSPSVVRAWIAIVISLTALLLERQSAALNSLGLALLFIALWDPFAARNIGFQFSFAVTASILLWFPYCNYLLEKVFPKRPLSHAICMRCLDRHGYCLLFFFRQSLALGIAVNLTALPLTLFHFQKFPMLSFIYNLFFPFLVSVSLLLLLLAILISLAFPWLGSILHALNESYTHFVLNFTFKLPKVFDKTLYASSLPAEGLILYVTMIFLLGIVASGWHRNRRELLGGH